MVRVPAVMQEDMQVATGVRSKGLPEIFDELAVEITDLRRWHRSLKYHESPTAKVNRCGDERLFHRESHVAVTPDTGFVSQRLFKRYPQADSDVFRCMVGIDMQIASSLDSQIHQRVLGKKHQHVI